MAPRILTADFDNQVGGWRWYVLRRGMWVMPSWRRYRRYALAMAAGRRHFARKLAKRKAENDA